MWTIFILSKLKTLVKHEIFSISSIGMFFSQINIDGREILSLLLLSKRYFKVSMQIIDDTTLLYIQFCIGKLSSWNLDKYSQGTCLYVSDYLGKSVPNVNRHQRSQYIIPTVAWQHRKNPDFAQQRYFGNDNVTVHALAARKCFFFHTTKHKDFCQGTFCLARNCNSSLLDFILSSFYFLNKCKLAT